MPLFNVLGYVALRIVLGVFPGHVKDEHRDTINACYSRCMPTVLLFVT